MRPLGLRIALRFPTTLVVAAPYLVLFLPTAVWNGNPETDFIIATAGMALAGAFVVESSVALVVLAERRSGRARAGRATEPRALWDGGRVAVVARAVTITSVVANLALVLLGGQTLTAQVNAVMPSGVLTVLTPFVSWSYVAVALVIAAHHLGGLTRWGAIRWILLLLATQVVLASVSNLTNRATAFLVVLATLGLLTRLVPKTWIVGAVGLCALVWPTVFAIRNAQRTANGIAVSPEVSAADRLRFDELITRAAPYGPGHDLGQPDLWDVVRYTLLPRLLDPDRAPVSSGTLINEFLGGSSSSSYTFMPVATSWFFWGPLVVVGLYAGYAALVSALRPWRTIEHRPVALVLFTLALGGPLSWFGTPPDASMSMLQTAISAIPVLVLLQVWARVGAGRDRRPRTRSPLVGTPSPSTVDAVP